MRCVGESWPLSLQRNFFTALAEHARVAPELLPKVFAFDAGCAAMVMEFLGEHIILRKGVMQGIVYPHFAEHITDYLAKTLFFTSDLYLSAGEKKEKMKIFCDNVDLCKITEDLIFTDPYRDADKNRWTSPGLDALAREFAADPELKVAVTHVKAKFLTATEALIHGDLHTGSIMVNQTETKVIDPEFAFYGPIGFDVGLLLANFFLGYFSQAGLAKNPPDYEEWLLEQVTQIWTKFEHKFCALWTEQLRGDYLPARLLTPDTARQVIDQVRRDYVARLFDDSLRFAATEETRALRAARELLLHHSQYPGIADVLTMIRAERARA